MMYRIGKVIWTIIVVLSIVFLAWLAISYIDVLINNLSTTPITYPKWNIFQILF